MVTETRILLGRHRIRNAIADKRRFTTLYKSYMRPSVVNATKSKLKRYNNDHDSIIFKVTLLNN